MKSLHLTYVGHATVLIEIDGTRVLTDPVLRDRVAHIRRQADTVDPDWFHSVDAVLISHLHMDHLDFPSLRLLGDDARLIVPRETGSIFLRRGFHNVEEIGTGESTTVGALDVTATYAHHTGSRYPFGPEADCLGFMIHGSHTVYFAGDTDIFPEMASLGPDLDLALLPVWGWGPFLGKTHLDPRRAAESLRLLRPKRAVPIHWGTFCPVGLGWMRPDFLTQPPHTFARHATDLAPEVDIHIVPPGEYLRLEN